MIIAVDFDGTCVMHDYPKIGKDIGAVPVLKQLIGKGHKLILWTMRSGKELEEAVAWFKEKEIPLYGINENPTQKIWTSSPKVHADLYIDDAALGAPLVKAMFGHKLIAQYIDWNRVEKLLKDDAVLSILKNKS